MAKCRLAQLLNCVFSFSVTPEKSDLVVSEVQMILVSHSLWNLLFYHGLLPPHPGSLFPFLSASLHLQYSCNTASFLLLSLASFCHNLCSLVPLPILSLMPSILFGFLLALRSSVFNHFLSFHILNFLAWHYFLLRCRSCGRRQKHTDGPLALSAGQCQQTHHAQVRAGVQKGRKSIFCLCLGSGRNGRGKRQVHVSQSDKYTRTQ